MEHKPKYQNTKLIDCEDKSAQIFIRPHWIIHIDKNKFLIFIIANVIKIKINKLLILVKFIMYIIIHSIFVFGNDEQCIDMFIDVNTDSLIVELLMLVVRLN